MQRVTTVCRSLLNTPVFTVTSSLLLLDNGFQRLTFPFLWVSELSLAATISFQEQQLKTTEPQQLSD
jgi:hypothetical protein